MNFITTVHVAFVISFKIAVDLSVVKNSERVPCYQAMNVVSSWQLGTGSKCQYQSKADASLCLDAWCSCAGVCRADIFTRWMWFIVLKGIYGAATNVVMVTEPKVFCCCDSTALPYPERHEAQLSGCHTGLWVVYTWNKRMLRTLGLSLHYRWSVLPVIMDTDVNCNTVARSCNHCCSGKGM
jgi:hypothetical protein